MAFALHAEHRGHGPRVVLVHGFTQSGASWAPIAGELEKSFEVVAVDLPGHGLSPVPEATSDLHLAARALGEAGGEGAYVGYSLGGRCCLHLAIDAPELVERLVVVGANPGIADESGRRARRDADDALAADLERGGDAAVARFVDTWLNGPLFAHLTEEQADRRSRLVNTAAGLAASLRSAGTGRQAPLWERLGELEMPVLVVVGARDDRFRPIAERTARAIGKNARLVIVAEAGHAVWLERPQAFVSLLAEFLAGLS
ncbi:MAG: alpha/beta fold hydrolase [Acidimicrobiales bacterium]|jgi:2-succinyl-6-hydroxy-2,4-cyclohexadiene-1-carboxylate synthase